MAGRSLQHWTPVAAIVLAGCSHVDHGGSVPVVENSALSNSAPDVSALSPMNSVPQDHRGEYQRVRGGQRLVLNEQQAVYRAVAHGEVIYELVGVPTSDGDSLLIQWGSPTVGHQLRNAGEIYGTRFVFRRAVGDLYLIDERQLAEFERELAEHPDGWELRLLHHHLVSEEERVRTAPVYTPSSQE